MPWDLFHYWIFIFLKKWSITCSKQRHKKLIRTESWLLCKLNKRWFSKIWLLFWYFAFLSYQVNWDTCSWKGQLERTRSWKVLSWKVWSWKVALKLERTQRSWKEPSEVGKNPAKLESSSWSWKARAEVGKYEWSWKVTYEVGKFKLNLERLNEVGKLLLNLERSIEVGKWN